jgi:hypothetical protein
MKISSMLKMACLSASLLISTAAFGQFKFGAQFMLVSASNGKVLEAGTDKVASLARPNSQMDNVCVYESAGETNQLWRIEPASNGTFRLVAVHNSKALTVGCDDMPDTERPNSQRDNVCVLNWERDNNQRWLIEKQDDGSFCLLAVHNEKALSVGEDDVIVRSRPMARRDNVCVLNWAETPNQRWFIIQVPAVN